MVSVARAPVDAGATGGRRVGDRRRGLVDRCDHDTAPHAAWTTSPA
jgi:hypothetical protein